MSRRTIICGLDLSPEPRSDCPDPLHDWPLPRGYVNASEVAGSRLYRGWKQRKCPKCHLYGWVPGRMWADSDVRVEVTP